MFVLTFGFLNSVWDVSIDDSWTDGFCLCGLFFQLSFLFMAWDEKCCTFFSFIGFFAFNELLYSSSEMLRASKGLEIGNNIIEIN